MSARILDSPFLIGAAIGSGSTALAAERGGADFLLALNAGRLRNMGAPSIACMLPIRDAQQLTVRFAREELLAQCTIPILLGVNVWGANLDPRGQAEQVQEAGFSGAVNFPSCMHYSRPMQQILSRAGRGIEQEVAQLRAIQDLGLTSIFYCATRTQARLAADAGLDLILLNLGWNVGGVLGHRVRSSLEEVATVARELGRLVKRISPHSRFLLEGGPIVTPEDLGRVISLAPIDGYVGGSTIERTPLEVSVADQIYGFRQASRRRAALDNESARLVTWSRQFGLVGRGKAQLEFVRRLRVFSQSRHPVLLLAESGLDTGPAIKALSAVHRRAMPSVVVEIDLAGEDPPPRARLRLFGQRETEALRPPALADGAIGCLVIRAAERLPKTSQRRLATALQSGRFRAPGGRRSLPVAPRVILVCQSAGVSGDADPDLTALGLESTLARTLASWALPLPALRERIDDLPRLLEAEATQSFGASLPRSAFSSGALQKLQAHLWPGNEEELRGLVGALLSHFRSGPIQPEELEPHLETTQRPAASARSERDRIVEALWRHGFNRSRAAEALGVSRKTLYNKMKKFRLGGE